MSSRRIIASTVAAATFVGSLMFHVPLASPAPSFDEQKSRLSSEQRATVSRVAQLNARIVNLQETSRAIAIRLAVSEVQLANLEGSLDRAEVAYKDQQAAFNRRLVDIYKNGSGFDFAVLSEANDLNAFVVRMRLLLLIADADQRQLTSLRGQKMAVTQARDRMAQIKADQAQLLDLQRAQLVEQKQALALQKRLLAKVSKKLKAVIAAEQAALAKAVQSAIRANKGLGKDIPSIIAAVDKYPGVGFVTAYDNPKNYRATGSKQSGEASWYGGDDGFNGQPTSSGEMYNDNDFTAAHKTLPFGTYLAVWYGGRAVIVRITDRGPFIHGRYLDLSKRAAQELGVDGVGNVTSEIVSPR